MIYLEIYYTHTNPPTLNLSYSLESENLGPPTRFTILVLESSSSKSLEIDSIIGFRRARLFLAN